MRAEVRPGVSAANDGHQTGDFASSDGRMRRRRPRRLTAGVAVPVALGVLAAGFAYEALGSRSAMTSVVVARRSLAAGKPVDFSDTRAVRVHSSDRSLLVDLLRPSQMGEGWVATVPVAAGEPVTRSEVQKPAKGPALGEMSIAVPVAQAVGGRLVPGDIVDVIASNGAGGAYYVAQRLRVVAVAPTSPANGALLGGNGSYYVVVSVGKQAALRVAAVLGNSGSGVEVVRSTSEAPTTRTSYGGPAAAGGRGRG